MDMPIKDEGDDTDIEMGLEKLIDEDESKKALTKSDTQRGNLLLEVFSRLGAREIVDVAAPVCRLWREEAHSKELWTTIRKHTRLIDQLLVMEKVVERRSKGKLFKCKRLGSSDQAHDDVGKYSKGMENAGALGSKDSAQGPGGIYHEKQVPNLCGMHALNNLLQSPAFTRSELDGVGQQLDQDERSMGMTFNPGEGNYRGDGFYNVTVLMKALEARGYQMEQMDQQTDWKKDAIKHAGEVGFIFNKDEHWFCYRRFHEEWFLLNSTQHRPVHFLGRELGSAVNFAVGDGWGVYSVRGNFPPCPLEGNEKMLNEAVQGSGGTNPVVIKFGGAGHTLGGGSSAAPKASGGYRDVPCDMCAGAGTIEGIGKCPACNGAKTSKVKVEDAPMAAMAASPMELVVDDSKPKTKVQLQFPDGTKKAEEFNVDHTVGDLRGVCRKIVGQAVKVKGGFPPKDLEDDTQTLEAAGLKGARVTVALA